MRVRALVVDDEPVARAGLRAMLARIEWIEVVGEAAHGPAAVEAIDALRPDLVLLDVQMPGMSGLEVLRLVRHRPYVVFTTAFAEHAVTAFELGAVDYVLKPFGAARLQAALERVRAAIGEPAPHPTLERLSGALGQGPITRLFVRSGGALVPLAVDRVRWFAADGDYVEVHVEGARHLLHLALARLEARLDPRRFLRIHRGCIVNLDQVRRFRRAVGGGMEAEMSDGTRLPVSRARAKDLREVGL